MLKRLGVLMKPTNPVQKRVGAVKKPASPMQAKARVKSGFAAKVTAQLGPRRKKM